MATILDSPHRIRDDEPLGFDGQVEVVLQLQYQINPQGEFEFSARTAARKAGSDDSSLEAKLSRTQWSRYLSKEEFVRSLDIGIIGADTVVHVETFGPHLFWSLTTDAITTKHDLTDLYGELRYFNDRDWLKREEYDKHFCRHIRFKAKLNTGGASGVSHKFSYNVLLRDRFGDMIEFEIDPDIKNPSV